ncbi:uncharacterized protein (TIGR02268 family) [Archangium gephyra]|uniref:Uncharacterized protein (TIGR02268 family) n=2 Tax=Archangium gephyra TaxID=48 RepID=A0ABX9KAU2_9BACT|nr:uncharacterized protein (TIGR02268 family) [Archangium gephyra]
MEGGCIELMADGNSDVPEVQISPGQPTTFDFDSDVRADGLALENRDRFKVAPGKRLITLVPSEKMRGEKPSEMTVCFEDGAAPACATFRLVVHPAIGERQVSIFRHARPVDSLQAELKKSYEENAKLRAEVERLREERDRPDGLTGLYASGMMDERGIPCSPLHVVQRAGEALTGRKAFACRAPGRMLVRVELQNPIGAAPWTAHGAKLTGPKGEQLKGFVWPPEPVLPGNSLTLFIEAKIENVQTVGPFILTLWEADGPRTVILGSVTFPALTEGPGL